jgi:hypothetical protein
VWFFSRARHVSTGQLSDLASLIEKHGCSWRTKSRFEGGELMSIFERIALEGRGGEEARGSLASRPRRLCGLPPQRQPGARQDAHHRDQVTLARGR